MKAIWTAIVLLPFVALVFSYLGALHPLGDSLAVFRAHILLVCLIALGLLAWAGHKWLCLAAATACLFSAMLLVWPRLGGKTVSEVPSAPYSMYQKNLSYRLQDTGPITEDLRLQAPDFISLQEVTPRNRRILAALADAYPARQFCAFQAVGGVAVAARWPKIAGSGQCADNSGLAAMQVQTPDGPVWVMALHLHWPYPFGQAAQVRQLARDIARVVGDNPAPVVLGGDFNMVPWSHAFGLVSTASQTMRVGGIRPSFSMLNGWLSLPIDHILVNRNKNAAGTSQRPELGSDHKGLLARFSIR